MNGRFRCGGLTVVPGEGRLVGPRAEAHLRPKTMDLLVALAERDGAVAAKGELLDAVWGGAAVSEAVLTNACTELRRGLARAGGSRGLVETVPRRGYRLTVPVTFEGPRPDPTRSLAVLPFEDLGSAAPADALIATLHAALTGELAALLPLRILPRAATAGFRPGAAALAEIGRRLRAQKLLTGSAVRNGTRVRVNVQLVDLATDRVRWSSSLVFALGDPIEAPAALARQVASELAAALDLARPAGPEGQPLDRRTADLFLRGQLLLRGSTVAMLEQGLADLDEVVRRQPDLAAAHAGRARGLFLLASWASDPGGRRLALAEEAAERALALESDSTEGEIWAIMTRVFGRRRLAGGIRPLARLVRDHPHNPEARDALAHCLAASGRIAEAVAEGRRALADDPLSPALRGALGFFLRCAGTLDEAASVLAEALELYPGWTIARLELGRVLWAAGERARAAAEIGPVDREWGDYVEALAAGREPAVTAQLARWRASGAVAPYWLAERAIWAGRQEIAIEQLERADEERQLRVAYARAETAFAPLRANARFQALLAHLAPAASSD